MHLQVKISGVVRFDYIMHTLLIQGKRQTPISRTEHKPTDISTTCLVLFIFLKVFFSIEFYWHSDGGKERLPFNRKRPPGSARSSHLLRLVVVGWREEKREKRSIQRPQTTSSSFRLFSIYIFYKNETLTAFQNYKMQCCRPAEGTFRPARTTVVI